MAAPGGSTRWPTDAGALRRLQHELATLQPEPWSPSADLTVGGCFVCFARGGSGAGARGDPGWAAAVVMRRCRILGASVVDGEAGAPYEPGLLAAREGPLLEAAIHALVPPPEVLLVNATGRDHPRRAGLALHLGRLTDLPSVGVTHRPFQATGMEPGQETGASTPMSIDGEQVGWLARTRASALPVAVSPGWRVDLDNALEVVKLAVNQARTPEPIRQARRLARSARGGDSSR